MIIPDSNLLLYSYNSESPYHPKISHWWSECLSGSETIGLCSVVLFSFVRIITNPRFFSGALSIDEAIVRVDSWFQRETVELLEMDRQDVPQTLAFLSEAGAGGNLTTDAQIAALALRHHGVVHSADADFARFRGVRWHNPLAAKPRK